MCFQGFAYYACGHNKIFERECELADAHPFWIKIACPNYQSQSARPNGGCGAGAYYCRETREGPFLDGVHETLDQAQDEMKQIDARFQNLKNVAFAFSKSANQAGIPHEVRRRHPAYNNILAGQNQVIQQRREANQRRMQAMATIQDSMAYFQRRAQHRLNGNADAFPAFTLPSVVQPRLPDAFAYPPVHQAPAPKFPRMSGAVSVTNQAIDVSQDAVPHQGHIDRVRQQEDPLYGDNIYVTPRRVARRIGSPEMHFGHAQLQEKETAESGSARKKRGRPRRIIEQGDTEGQTGFPGRSPKRPRMPEGSSNIRRSARNRDKKVSYAESEGSSFRSRNPSPNKSEISDASPSRSDWTGSPAKSEEMPRKGRRELKREINELNTVKISRASSSLGSMIDDWKKRSGMAMGGPQRQQQMQSQEQYTPGTMLGHGGVKHEQTMSAPKTTQSFYSDPAMPSLMLPRARAHMASTQRMDNMSQEMRPPTRRGFPPPNHFGVPYGSNMGLHRSAALPNFGPAFPSENSLPNLYNSYAGRFMSTAGLTLPYSDSQLTTPPNAQNADRHWSVNMPSFGGQVESPPSPNYQPTGGEMQFGPELPGIRSDSIIGGISIGGEGAQSSMTHAPSSFNYDRMRRSFSATADLTPPALVDLTSKDTEPKKRPMPASSPLLSSSKRVRLSLPRSDKAPNANGGNIPSEHVSSMSSPPKMPSQQLATGDTGDELSSPPADEKEDLPSMTAPILAPAAVMFMPSQEHEGGGDQDAESADLSDIFGAQEAAEDYGGNHFSDIDWGYVNDDVV